MAEFDRLYRIALENAAIAKNYRKRYLFTELEHVTKARKKGITLISGIRGVGKTTLMLQLFNRIENAFYFSADSVLVRSKRIYDMVENLYRQGYTTIFIDEIHKYPRWIEELKNIYDSFNVRIVASGSSTAAIKKGNISLGRRSIGISLTPLEFGEFIYLKTGKRYSASFAEMLDKKKAMQWMAEHPEVEKYYGEYLIHGGFPIEAKEQIFPLVKKMIYEDALAEFSLTRNKVDVAERLLGFLSLSRPGEFSYTSFSNMSNYAKSTIYETVNMLKELEILCAVEGKKPKEAAKGTIKLLFSHPNIRVAFAEQLMNDAAKGALREEYFVFHMNALGIPLQIPKKGRKNPDYLANIKGKELICEVGGKAKSRAQLMGKKGVVLSDENLVVLGFVQKTNQKQAKMVGSLNKVKYLKIECTIKPYGRV